jgi:hypothetical protein
VSTTDLSLNSPFESAQCRLGAAVPRKTFTSEMNRRSLLVVNAHAVEGLGLRIVGEMDCSDFTVGGNEYLGFGRNFSALLTG